MLHEYDVLCEKENKTKEEKMLIQAIKCIHGETEMSCTMIYEKLSDMIKEE